MIFNKSWFSQHQKALLWFLNIPVVSWWFRWVLRINGERSLVGKNKIIGILPNAIFWKGKKRNQYVTEFRSHNKFSKRIYFAFHPLWLLLHLWDWLWYPNFNLGFDTSTFYPDPDPESTSVDGRARAPLTDNQTWATIRGHAGDAAVDTEVNTTANEIRCGTTSGWQLMDRGFFLFNTSSLGANANISAANFDLYVTAKTQNLAGQSVALVSSAPASNTALVAGDYDSLGETSFATALTVASLTLSAYNTWTVNSTGIADIVTTGVTKYGTRLESDRANAEPTFSANALTDVSADMADQTGTSTDPRLVVTYSLPAVGNYSYFM